ncbi:MAG: ATP-binding protein [Gammaproteobacteria bacterium]|nr:ATP-binding protein [Gammaproteobacteria bacterium]
MVRRGPSLGGKLLLASLLLLTLPWLAWRALLAFEAFLVDGQLRSLELLATGAALLLEPEAERLGHGRGSGTTTLYAWPMTGDQAFDGYPGEWREHPGNGLAVGADTFGFSLRLGTRDGWLHGLVAVRDPVAGYRNPGEAALDHSDAVVLELHADDGVSRYRVLTAQGPGRVAALPSTPDGSRIVPGPSLGLEAQWQPASGGYTVEFRLPLAVLAGHPVVRVRVHDADRAMPRGRTLATPPLRPRHRDPGLEALLGGLAAGPPRAWVVDRDGWVRAGVGGPSGLAAEPRRLARIDLPLLGAALEGRPGSAQVRRAGTLLAAAVPLRAGGEVLGAVLVEQPLDALLQLRYRTFAEFGAASLALLGASVLALLLFAGRLAWRIRRLGREAGAAIDARGRQVSTRLAAEARSGDELGELSRAISALLVRLRRHTRFVESLPRTLRHELSNPLNSVATALANLAEERSDAGRQALLARAGRGLERVEKTLATLTEAADLEEALQGDPRTRLDLAALLRGYLESFALQHPERRLEASLPAEPAPVDGVDHRLEQMLDKLLDNAVDFTPPEGTIAVELGRDADGWRLAVANDGPLLPPGLEGRLFETLVSGRPRADGRGHHLGLGLYVVRRVAEAHGGRASVRNRADGRGVTFSVWLPAVA